MKPGLALRQCRKSKTISAEVTYENLNIALNKLM